MSIQYLLDGYNIIHQMKGSNLSDLEGQRSHLIRFIEKCSPQGSVSNAVTIVFDGREEFFGSEASRTVKIVFSRGESADDKIKKLVSEAKNKKSTVVVSDDRAIQYAGRALGAKTSSVQDFLDKGYASQRKERPINKKNEGSLKSEKNISKSDETRITTEMGAIWLKSNNGQKK